VKCQLLDIARPVGSAEFPPLPLNLAELFYNVSIPQGADKQANESQVSEADREQNAHRR